MIAILLITKGHHSIKMYHVELQFLFSAHHMMVLYICTKFHEKMLYGFRVMEWTKFPFLSLQRGIIM